MKNKLVSPFLRRVLDCHSNEGNIGVRRLVGGDNGLGARSVLSCGEGGLDTLREGGLDTLREGGLDTLREGGLDTLREGERGRERERGERRGRRVI